MEQNNNSEYTFQKLVDHSSKSLPGQICRIWKIGIFGQSKYNVIFSWAIIPWAKRIVPRQRAPSQTDFKLGWFAIATVRPWSSGEYRGKAATSGTPQPPAAFNLPASLDRWLTRTHQTLSLGQITKRLIGPLLPDRPSSSAPDNGIFMHSNSFILTEIRQKSPTERYEGISTLSVVNDARRSIEQEWSQARRPDSDLPYRTTGSCPWPRHFFPWPTQMANIARYLLCFYPIYHPGSHSPHYVYGVGHEWKEILWSRCFVLCGLVHYVGKHSVAVKFSKFLLSQPLNLMDLSCISQGPQIKFTYCFTTIFNWNHISRNMNCCLVPDCTVGYRCTSCMSICVPASCWA